MTDALAIPEAVAVLCDEGAIVRLVARYESPNSRATVLRMLSLLAAAAGAGDARGVPWAKLDAEHVDALRGELAKHYAPATVNLALSVLRTLLEQLWLGGLIDRERYERLRRVRNVRGSRLPRGRALSLAEIQRLLEVCDSARDLAMVALLYGGGLRRAELVALDVAQLDMAKGELRFLRKGNKEQALPLPQGTRTALARWLVVRGDAPGPLFYPLRKDGTAIARRMTAGNIRLRLVTLATRGGIAAFTPHDLRRSYLSDMLDRTDAFLVQQLAGHSDPRTTVLYDRRPDEARRRAVALLSVPLPETLLGAGRDEPKPGDGEPNG